MSYRNDLNWQQAQRQFVNPVGDCSGERMVSSIMAAVAMWEVERTPEPVSEERAQRIAALLLAGGAK